MATKNGKKYKTKQDEPILVDGAIRDRHGRIIDRNYAKQNGYYAGMTVGLAENLVSPDGVLNTPETDPDYNPFLFRTTAGAQHIIDGVGEIKKVRGRTFKDMSKTNRATLLGNTMKWNQLVGESNVSTVRNVTLTGSRITFTSDTNSVSLFNIKNFVIGHKYLFASTFDYSAYGVSRARIYGSSTILYSLDGIFTSDTVLPIVLTITGNTIPQGYSFYLYAIDLTDIYGAGNEPTDVNDPRVQALIAYAKEHPEYDESSLKNVAMTQETVCGENLLPNDGSINNVFIKAGTKLYFSSDGKSRCQIAFMNLDGSYNDTWTAVESQTYNTPREITCLYDSYGVKIYTGTYPVSNGQLSLTPLGHYTPFNSQTIQFSAPVELNGLDTSKDETYSYVEGNELVTKKIQRYENTNITRASSFIQSGVFRVNLIGGAYKCIGIFDKYNFNVEKQDTNTDRMAQSLNNLECTSYRNDSTNAGAFVFKDNRFTTIDEVNAYLSSNPIAATYKLATPIITEISRVPLTCDFEHIENIITNNTSLAQETPVIGKGVIDNVKALSLVTTGFNQWDEDLDVGWAYRIADGYYNVNPTYSSSKNKIDVFPNTEYYFNFPSSVIPSDSFIFMWDKDDNYITWFRLSTISENKTYRMPNNVHKIAFSFNNGNYGTTYHHDICINISWTGYRNGQYERYWKQTKDLPILTHFPEGMNGINDVYDDLDFTIKKGHRRIGRVDLSTLEYEYLSNLNCFRALWRQIDIKIYSQTEPFNAACELYTPVPIANFSTGGDLIMRGEDDVSRFYIRDTKFGSDVASFKQSLQGVYLYYELATPEEFDLDETYSPLYKVSDFGTEELVYASNTMAIPVPMELLYQDNLKDKLRGINPLTEEEMNELIYILEN